ncbi:S-layer homology domain-containing protein [Paenibacillus illinoisensis]|uniref:S-layer homology domain-containing protein n=1 Tax=Paenibacillus illinoisensis TaxID=59845 RepID=UPI003017E6ED
MNSKWKKFNRKLSLMLSTSLVVSMLSLNLSVSAEVATSKSSFTDIDHSYAKTEITKLVEQGILTGFSDGTFKPSDAVTRAQLAKIMVGALKLNPDTAEASKFKDIKEDQWYAGYVGALVKSGIAQGTSKDSFSPNKNVTREELAVFFVRAFGWNQQDVTSQTSKPQLFDLDQVSNWAKDSVALAYQSGFIKGLVQKDGTVKFNPSGIADRQALARLAYEFVMNKSTYDSYMTPAKTEDGTEESNEAKPETTKPSEGSSKGSSGSSSGDKGNGSNNGGNNGGGEQAPSKNLTAPGEYTLGDVTGNVTISSKDVTLKNTKINGNLRILESVENGDVTLDNVNVTGTTEIYGGGPNSIHAVNSVLATVIVDKADGSIRLVLEGGSDVQQIEIRSGAIVQNVSTGQVGPIDIAESVPHNASVALSGSFDSVMVHAEQISVEFGDDSTIGNLEVFEQALNTVFKINHGAVVNRAILNAIVQFSGGGALNSALVNVEGIDFSQLSQPPAIEADPTVTSVVYSPETAEFSAIDSTRQIVLTGVTGSASKDLTSFAKWKVEDSTIAVVNSGKIQAKGNGTTVVQAQYGDFEINVPVTVAVYNEGAAYPTLTGIQVTNGSAKLVFTEGFEISELTADDFVVHAYLNGTEQQLNNLQYDNGEFTFDAVNSYGSTLYITVESDVNKTHFAGSQSGAIKLTGFGGHIKDVAGEAVANLQIAFRKGLDNKTGEVVGTVTTDTYGNYQIYLPPGIYTGELGGGDTKYIKTYLIGVSAVNVENRNENQTAIEIPSQDETRIVLTWGKDPADLDSHLVGPAGDNSMFHTFFADKQYYNNDELMVDLDLDDVTSYGPETTTIRQLLPGTYTFYVHHFSGVSTIKSSGAKIEVFHGAVASPSASFTVEEGSGNERYWVVFKMIVADNGTVTFESVDTFTDINPLNSLQSSVDHSEEEL